MENNMMLYPLTIAQKNQLYFLKRYSQTTILNRGLSVKLDCKADLDLLKASAAEAVSRCESVRLRFCNSDDGSVMQYIADANEFEIEEADLSELADFEAESVMTEWTKRPITVFDAPVNRIVIVKLAQGAAGVYLCYHLMAMDAQAASLFLSDVSKIYASKAKGTQYPAPTASYTEAVKKELEYQNSELFEQDRQYWYSFISSSEAYYADIRGPKLLSLERKYRNFPFLRACVNTSKSPDTSVSRFHLESEPSQRIINFCEHHGITVESFLKMAVRTYLSKMNYNQSDISIINVMVRRDDDAKLLSGGKRTHFFPCRSIINSEEIFIDAVKKIETAQSENLKHADFDTIAFWQMRADYYKNSMSQAYESMTFSYQPPRCRGDFPPQLNCTLKSHSSGAGTAPLFLSVTHRIEDNGLDFTFDYQKNRYEPQDMNSFYYYIGRIMFAAIDNCYATVGEIISRV